MNWHSRFPTLVDIATYNYLLLKNILLFESCEGNGRHSSARKEKAEIRQRWVPFLLVETPCPNLQPSVSPYPPTPGP